jgi:hypothetical protein
MTRLGLLVSQASRLSRELVYHHPPSIQTSFRCKLSKGHLVGTKTSARENVSPTQPICYSI